MIQEVTTTGIDLIVQCNDLQQSKGWALTSMMARGINLARMSCLGLATGSFSDTFSSFRMLLDRLITLKYLEDNSQYEEFAKFSYAISTTRLIPDSMTVNLEKATHPAKSNTTGR